MNKVAGVIGCGWLGLPLAREMLAQGWQVRGTTTRPEKLQTLKASGISPFLLLLDENRPIVDLPLLFRGLELAVINVPPKLRKGKGGDYVKKIRMLQKALLQYGVKKLLFVSSTSVYGEQQGIITENTPPSPTTESGRQLLLAEQLIADEPGYEHAIVRFGGLIASDRHPVTYLSGKKDLERGADPVNLIHRNDAIRLILEIISKGYWGVIFNGVHPSHPSRAEYYRNQAAKKGLPMPEFRVVKPQNAPKLIESRNILDKNLDFFTSIE